MTFHMHDIEIDGQFTRVPYPGPVYDCPDDQCRTERAVIRGLSEWPLEQLSSHIKSCEAQVDKALDMLIRLREARELKLATPQPIDREDEL